MIIVKEKSANFEYKHGWKEEKGVQENAQYKRKRNMCEVFMEWDVHIAIFCIALCNRALLWPRVVIIDQMQESIHMQASSKNESVIKITRGKNMNKVFNTTLLLFFSVSLLR